MKNTITFYINDEDKLVYKQAKEKAKKSGKSVSKVIITLLRKYIKSD